ncbi:O-antigen ligase family protein [Microbacterium schleiferi]|uniref:O-antigen ligase family protein n=1 Tax=Microbacterium schleiferi TaxID=69362 RepID=UPI00311F0562
MQKIGRTDFLAWTTIGVAVVALLTLLWTDSFVAVPIILGMVAGLAFGMNRGLPYLLLFAALSSATGLKYGALTVGDVLAIAAVAFGLMGRIIHKDGAPILWPYVAPALVFLWGAVVAAAHDVPVVPVAIFAGSIVVVIAAFTLPIRTERQLELVAAAFVIGACVNSISAVLDYLNVFDVTAFTASDRLNDTRPPGLTTHSNQLALVTYLALPFAYHLTGRRPIWGVSIAVLAAGAFATGSRGALIGAVIVTVLYILISGRRVFGKFTIAILAAIVVILVATELGLTTGLTRLTGDASADQSDVERVRRAQVALSEFFANPITGVGFTTGEAHNFYLEVARSGGLVTLVIMVVFAATVLIAGWRVRRQVAIAVPALASASIWFIMAFQQNSLNVRFIWVPVGFVLAAVALSNAISKQPSLDEPVLTTRLTRKHRARGSRVSRPSS